MLKNETNSDLVFGLTRALQSFAVPGAVPVLADTLSNNKNYLSQVAATHALAAQGGEDAKSTLRTALETGAPTPNQTMLTSDARDATTTRMHIILSLGEANDESSVDLLRRVLLSDEENVMVRNVAAESIGRIGGTNAATALRTAVSSVNDESALVYIARGLAVCGDVADATLCINRSASVQDEFTKTTLQKAADDLLKKGSHQ
jgi:HEAT repeat protein